MWIFCLRKKIVFESKFWSMNVDRNSCISYTLLAKYVNWRNTVNSWRLGSQRLQFYAKHCAPSLVFLFASLLLFRGKSIILLGASQWLYIRISILHPFRVVGFCGKTRARHRSSSLTPRALDVKRSLVNALDSFIFSLPLGELDSDANGYFAFHVTSHSLNFTLHNTLSTISQSEINTRITSLLSNLWDIFSFKHHYHYIFRGRRGGNSLIIHAFSCVFNVNAETTLANTSGCPGQPLGESSFQRHLTHVPPYSKTFRILYSNHASTIRVS